MINIKYMAILFSSLLFLIEAICFLNLPIPDLDSWENSASNKILTDKYFSEMNNNRKVFEENEIVVIIDGEPISRLRFEDQRTLLSINGLGTSDQEVIDVLIEPVVVYNEAVKRGLEASYEEAEIYASELMKEILELGGEHLEFATQVAQLQNMTVEEFFTHEETIKVYQKVLSMGNLLEQVYNSVEFDEDIPPENRYDLETEAYEKLVKDLKEKATIEMKSI